MNFWAYLSIATIFISHGTYASQVVVRGTSSLLPALRSSTGSLLRPGTPRYGLAYTRQLGTSIPQPGTPSLLELFKEKVTSQMVLNKRLDLQDFMLLTTGLIDAHRQQVLQKKCPIDQNRNVERTSENPLFQKSLHSLFNKEAEKSVSGALLGSLGKTEANFHLWQQQIKDLIKTVKTLEAEAHATNQALFFHAQRNDFVGLTILNTRLAEIFSLTPYQNSLFRSLKNYESFSTPDDIIRSLHEDRYLHDNMPHLRDKMIAATPSLYSNFEHKGESSLWYFINNRSILEATAVLPLYESTCAAYGLSKKLAQAIYKLSLGTSQNMFGVLYVILIPKDKIAATAYPAVPFGIPALQDTHQSQDIPVIQPYFPALKTAHPKVMDRYRSLGVCQTTRFYEALHALPEMFTSIANQQFRIAITKDIMANPGSGVTVHMLTVNQKELDQQKEEMIRLIDQAIMEKIADNPDYLKNTALGDAYQHFLNTIHAAQAPSSFNLLTAQEAWEQAVHNSSIIE